VLPHQRIQNESVGLHSDPNRVSESLSILQHGRPNLLMVGSPIQNERVLEQVHPVLRAPVAWWSPVERPEIPATAFRALIVRNVECLTAGQQVSFAAWLRRFPDIQIVSIATMPVFPLVKEGTFSDELYYLLNVVLLEAAPFR
jgi:hypothetical protein